VRALVGKRPGVDRREDAHPIPLDILEHLEHLEILT
jgi:hypothetical protein